MALAMDVGGLAETEGDLEARAYLTMLDAALASIEREADVALRRPDIAFLTMCRISSLARQTRAKHLTRRARPR